MKIFPLLFIAFLQVTYASAQCHPDDYNALRELYFATEGDNWTSSTNWDVTSPSPPANCDLSTWQGIILNNNNRVSILTLPANNLSGSLGPSISGLSELIEIFLDGNMLIGPIPSELYDIPTLENIILSNNMLDGEISSDICNLSSLTELRVGVNQLNGSIPSCLGGYLNLGVVDISSNMISGCYPAEWTAYCGTTQVNFANNPCLRDWDEFCDTNGNCTPAGGATIDNYHPDDLTALMALFTDLQYSYLSEKLTWHNSDGWVADDCGGPIDLSLWYGVTLNSSGRVVELDLSNNNLNGYPLPPEIGLLTELEYLDLSNNTIGSGWLVPRPKDDPNFVPTNYDKVWQKELKKLTKLKYLDISANILSGPINANEILSSLVSLEEIYFGNMPVGINLPSALLTLPNIKIIGFQNALSAGPLPPDLFSTVSSSLETVDLRYNNYSECFHDYYMQACGNFELLLDKDGFCQSWEDFCNNGPSTTSDIDGGLYDKWMRPLANDTLLLHDWEGHMGNPEIRVLIVPPSDMTGDINARIYTEDDTPLLYALNQWDGIFELLPANEGGFDDNIYIKETRKHHPIRLGVQPDRNSETEEYEMTIVFTDDSNNQKTVKQWIKIKDDDDFTRSPDFTIHLDTDADFRYNYFDQYPEREAVLKQALDDMAYYFDDQSTDVVPAESMSIGTYYPEMPEWQEPYANQVEFDDFYMVAHSNDNYRAGGNGPFGESEFLYRNGVKTDLRGMGHIIVNMKDSDILNADGEYYYSTYGDDENWWRANSTIFGNSPTDDCPNGASECDYNQEGFYGTMQHEAYHTLAGNSNYPEWVRYVNEVGCFDHPEIQKLYGKPCLYFGDPVHAQELHMHQRVGGEGLIDKGTMTLFKAVGWQMRETTPFMSVRFVNPVLNNGETNIVYSATISAEYGVGAYNFSLDSGALPNGLSLDSFTGEIHGVPTMSGNFTFTIKVEDNDVDNDYNPNGVIQEFSITIEDKEATCLELLELSGTVGNSSIYNSKENTGIISSNQIISSPSDVEYNSGNHILFNPHFEVIMGATLRAYIEGCTNASMLPASKDQGVSNDN